MRQRADDGDRLLVTGDDGATFEQHLEAGDAVRRPVGKVEQGTLFDPAALAVALAQQDGRRRVAIGNRFDIHGNMITVKTGQTSLKYHITWLQFGTWRTKKLAISIVSLHGKQEVPSRLGPRQGRLRRLPPCGAADAGGG